MTVVRSCSYITKYYWVYPLDPMFIEISEKEFFQCKSLYPNRKYEPGNVNRQNFYDDNGCLLAYCERFPV